MSRVCCPTGLQTQATRQVMPRQTQFIRGSLFGFWVTSAADRELALSPYAQTSNLFRVVPLGPLELWPHLLRK